MSSEPADALAEAVFNENTCKWSHHEEAETGGAVGTSQPEPKLNH